jgi:hypothetical protein
MGGASEIFLSKRELLIFLKLEPSRTKESLVSGRLIRPDFVFCNSLCNLCRPSESYANVAFDNRAGETGSRWYRTGKDQPA